MRPKASLVVASVTLALSTFSQAIDVGRLPGNTITNEKGTTLQFGLRSAILENERKVAPQCSNSRITDTAIIGQAVTSGRIMRWSERWTVNRCGAHAEYIIHFDFRGSIGTYSIQTTRAITGTPR